MNAVASGERDLRRRLADLAAALWPEVREVVGLRRLAGGPQRENWAFDAVCEAGTTALVLRLGRSTRPRSCAAPSVEAALLQLVRGVGVPAPSVRLVLRPENRIGDGFVMERVAGIALGGEALPPALTRLTRDCGRALARIHQAALGSLPPLRSGPATVEIAACRAEHGGPDVRRTQVVEFAFEWLRRQAPGAPTKPALVHGDFRPANLIVDAGAGLRAVLDWKSAHLGDPMEDLGRMFADADDRDPAEAERRAALCAGYEDAGGRVDPDRVHYWEVFGTLKRSLAPTTLEVATLRLQRLLDR